MIKNKIHQICSLICLFGIAFGMTGCSEKEVQLQQDDDKIQIVCTVYPAYEWTMQILGERADDFEVTWLLSKGTDIHNYQPSVADIAKIKQSDLFIYVGGESDAWVEDVLAADVSRDHKAIALMDSAGLVLCEENDEGILQNDAHDHANEHAYDHDHDHDHDHDNDHDHEDEEQEMSEYDEHVWLSLKNACVIVDEIAGQITALMGDTTGIYRDNAAAYEEKLIALDAKYAQVIEAGEKDTLIFADRFPFRYMAEDYGLKYYAAFNGCSAETEASFETLTSMAEKVDALDVHYLILIDGSDEMFAKTVISVTDTGDQGILRMDSLQAVTKEEREDGLTYLQVMEDNLAVIQKALQ